MAISQHFLCRFGPRQYFGERALLRNEPRAATVRVVSKDAKALALDKARKVEIVHGKIHGIDDVSGYVSMT